MVSTATLSSYARNAPDYDDLKMRHSNSPPKNQSWNTSLNHVADIFALIYYSYFQLPLSLSSDDHLASCDDAVYSEASWNTKSKQAHLTNIFFFTFFFFLSLSPTHLSWPDETISNGQWSSSQSVSQSVSPELGKENRNQISKSNNDPEHHENQITSVRSPKALADWLASFKKAAQSEP